MRFREANPFYMRTLPQSLCDLKAKQNTHKAFVNFAQNLSDLCGKIQSK